jgi:hypothetical protein
MSVKTKLIDALNFIAPAIRTTDHAFAEYACLSNHFAIVSNNQLSMGHPIEEDLEACPQFDKFKAAKISVGKTFPLLF